MEGSGTETPEARFGALLRELRNRSKLSARALGSELHRAHNTIIEYENGQRLPPVDAVVQYEAYFGLPRGTLLVPREHARVARLHDPRDGTLRSELGDSSCPYPGLRPFDAADAAFFFGREEPVEEAAGRLERHRFLAVVGASGSGKSSFARAGLVPLARGPVALLAPGELPLDALASAVEEATDGGVAVAADDLRADPAALARATRRLLPGLLIVVDQFEELYTLCRDDAERQGLIAALLSAWRDPASTVRVILTLRGDFYDRVASPPELGAAVVAHQVLIGPMSPRNLRRAIELPALEGKLTLQPGLAETVVEDLGVEPGALPLLAHALFETWQRRSGVTLTVDGYRAAGGVRGAIAQTAEVTLQQLSDSDQAIAKSIFLSLTELGDGAEPTRRHVDRSEFAELPEGAEGVDRVLGILARARLISVDAQTVDIAHEALIRHWPSLRGWIDSDRAGLVVQRRLTLAAREWEDLGREAGALYRGARLAEARAWAAEHPRELPALAREFLAAARSAEQRRVRRLRALAIAAMAVAAIVAVVALWALRQRDDAQRRATDATALALAASSSASTLLNARPDISLLLALEAYRVRPRVEARGAVIGALNAVRAEGVAAILHGHAGKVTSVAFSPDGTLLASASDDRTIRFWSTRTHRQTGSPLRGHSGEIDAIAFSPDGKLIASGSRDASLRLWDVGTRREVAKLPSDGFTVHAVAFSPNGEVLASRGAQYDAGDSIELIRLWDVRSRRALEPPLRGHGDIILTLAFSPDGSKLASGGHDKTVRIWDLATRRQLGGPLRGSTEIVNSVIWGDGGRIVVSSGGDNEIRVWDAATHVQLRHVKTTDAMASLALSRDGRTLASAGYNHGDIGVWDLATLKPIGPVLRGHSDSVASVAFNRDGRTLASGSSDTTVRLWDVAARPRLGTLLGTHADGADDVVFSPHGSTLASIGEDAPIRLWDVRTHRLTGRLAGTGGGLRGVLAFGPAGTTLAAAGDDDRMVRTWDLGSRAPARAPTQLTDSITRAVALSPDGHTAAGSDDEDGVELWDLRTRARIGAPLKGHTDVVQAIVFSADGLHLAAGGFDTSVRLWDVRARRPWGRALRGHTSSISTLAFSPDGLTLASGSEDGTVRLWDLRSFKPLGQPLQATAVGAVLSLAFSPDGATLAVGGARAIRLWDVAARRLLGSPLQGGAVGVAFSPDGLTLASAGGAGDVRLWEGLFWHDIAALQAQVCRLVGSGLSRAEWDQYAGGLPYRQSCA